MGGAKTGGARRWHKGQNRHMRNSFHQRARFNILLTATSNLGKLYLTRYSGGDVKKIYAHIGSSFDDFLDEEGIRDDVEAVAVKRVIAWQISQAMQELNLTKSMMAERMQTSRTQLDRLLDPKNDKIQLDTILRGAKAVGRKLRFELV
jgi:predicted XRE-type DNA-binding protein